MLGRLARRRSRRPAPVGFAAGFPATPSVRLAREKEPTISVLRNLESRIEGLVEGVFSRAFSSEVQPVELARKLAKEMDAHKTAGVARVYVPNEYTVFLSSKDRVKLEGYERSLEQELSGYLLEHARRRSYDLLTRPAVEFKTDERLRLGEFGIQTRLVKPPAREGEAPSQGEEGHTMVYSAVKEKPQPAAEPRAARRGDGRDPRGRLARRPPLRAGGAAGDDRPLEAGRVRARATPTSPAATPSCAARRRATGRSPTSARPTASR